MITINGQEYKLDRQAYLDQTGTYYTSTVTASDDEVYQITWGITNPDADELDDMCDWGNYAYNRY